MYLVQFYKWLDRLPCQVKTILILSLIGVVGLIFANNNIKEYLEDQYRQQQELLYEQESYLEKAAPQINDIMDKIIMSDECISNVLLLNYHNTLISSNGLAYKKLTAISEKFRGLDNNPCIDYWVELEYINFIDEIKKVNQNDFIIIDREPNSQIRFPNFQYRLKKCEYNIAVLYPISGLNECVGMLVVIYKGCNPDINIEYYHNNIYHSLQKLSILLDFNNIRKKYES